jgi:hypothetical protein
MREKILESYINNGIRTKLELFFGRGSTVEIKRVFPLTQKKITQVEIHVRFTDPEVSISYWPQNINWLVEEAWEFVHGKGTQCVVQSSYDIL